MALVYAPAKINLRLKVVSRQPDGYHNLEMVMVKLGLADEIDWTLAPSGISIECESPDLPRDERNLLWKAALLASEVTGVKFGLRIRLEKRIPIAAGLGGGSSDAAALLKGLNLELGFGWTSAELSAHGSRLGADIPFFLQPHAACEARGTGEVLKPVSMPDMPLILVNPGFPLSTREVYQWFDVSCRDSRAVRLTRLNLGASFPPLENDLEEVVIPRYPVLAQVKERLLKAGALGALMSGSGPTVFGLFDSTASRDRGYKILLDELDPRWWVCRTEFSGVV